MPQHSEPRQHTAAELSAAETEELRCIAGYMIPASTEYDVPGADDPVILADIVASLGRDQPQVRAALATLAALSGGSFAALPEAHREEIADAFLASGSAAVVALGRAVLQCYYRDDRVVRSLGLEPGPPFPRGRTLPPSDWSLLDPVKERDKFWREAP